MMKQYRKYRQRLGQRGLKKHFSQRGVALLAVAVALLVTSVIVKEFSTNTTIDYITAGNARDDMKAHFLARSTVNLSQLVIRLQTDFVDKYRKYVGDMQIADYTPMFIGAFCGSKEEVESMSAMLGGFEGEALKGLGTGGGTCDVRITSDDSKINMNCANGNDAERATLKTLLDVMVYFDAYNPVFESADAEGWRRDRSTQVNALIDYVDKDNSRYDAAGSPEDYGYETLTDSYLPKNNYIDTIGEIKLARGVDDRFWNLFGQQFTVYGGCKVNIGSVDSVLMYAAIIFLSVKDENDPVVTDPNKLWALARRVVEAKSMGQKLGSARQFAMFVKNPDITELLAFSGETAPPPTDGVIVEGVELDRKKLDQIIGEGPRRTYRVEATATVGVVHRKVTAVWDTKTTNQNARDPNYQQGTWVFWREE